MLNVALTGNVAAGKTTVLQWFAAWGATVIDADELVREAQQRGSTTLAAIARRFGADVLRPDGSLDRDTLRRQVMGDDEARASLNAIVHPIVRRRRAEIAEQAAARGDCVLVNDIPLLFEVLDPDDFDLVVLVDAPADLRRGRLMSLRGLGKHDADLLIASQLPTEPKRAHSDIVIDNAGTLDAFETAAREAWRTTRIRAARAAAGGAAPLLAVFAHAGDEAFTIGGTLARYADAGIETHLVCATKRGAATRGWAHKNSIAELDAAAAELHLASVTVLDYRDGELLPDDTTGANAVAEVIKRVVPRILITFGSDGCNGNRDHMAVHAWTAAAWTAAGSACSLYCVAYPKKVAQKLSGAVHHTPKEHIAARLDVRPWQDVKRRGLAAYSSWKHPFDLADRSAQPPVDCEWYSAKRAPNKLVVDLYETPTVRG